MTDKEIQEFAKKNGYTRAELIGTWKGFKVYTPIYRDDKQLYFVGAPRAILVKGNKIRFSRDYEELNDITENMIREEKEKVIIEVMPKDFSEREIAKALQYKRVMEAVLNDDKKEIDKIIEELVDNEMKKVIKKLGLKKSVKNKAISNKEAM